MILSTQSTSLQGHPHPRGWPSLFPTPFRTCLPSYSRVYYPPVFDAFPPSHPASPEQYPTRGVRHAGHLYQRRTSTDSYPRCGRRSIDPARPERTTRRGRILLPNRIHRPRRAGTVGHSSSLRPCHRGSQAVGNVRLGSDRTHRRGTSRHVILHSDLRSSK